MDGSPEFLSLNREASLAYETAITGLGALSRAHSSRTGLYYTAFFNLSASIERIGKLVLVIDHVLKSGGQFPTDDDLRKVGHDVVELTKVMRQIRTQYPDDDHLCEYPDDEIVENMLSCLSDFSMGARYYNLDKLVGGRGLARAQGDPIGLWQNRVSALILKTHYARPRKSRDEELARYIGTRMEPFSMVRGWDEEGNAVNDVTTMLQNSQAAKYVQRWAPYYLCKLFRFYTMLLKALSYASLATNVQFIPWMGDHFGRFVNEDSFFKKYKVWRQ